MGAITTIFTSGKQIITADSGGLQMGEVSTTFGGEFQALAEGGEGGGPVGPYVQSWAGYTGIVNTNMIALGIIAALGYTPQNPATLSYSQLQDAPFFADVAYSGDYQQLGNKPFIPTTPGDIDAATEEQGALAQTAVQPAALTTALSAYVEKATGYGLSQQNFTLAEKQKLASLQDDHYKGTYITEAQLTSTVPTAAGGDYADVDAGTGTNAQRYIWDISDAKWVPSTQPAASLTAAQVKSLFLSNADTYNFDTAARDKLGGIQAEATKNVDTDSLPEKATNPVNRWFTEVRARAVTLLGLSVADSSDLVAGDSSLGAFGKLQAQLTAVRTSISSLSSSVTSALGNKVDKDGSKVLSDNNFTNTLKTKLDGLTSSSMSVIDRSASFTFGLADMNNVTRHPATDTTERIFNIPSNAELAIPIGSCAIIDNNYGAGKLTITINGTDVLSLVGPNGSTGTRTIASGGQAMLIKETATLWRMSGVGVA